jgi:hypothetical protein
MKYDNSNQYPREEAIKRIELEDSVVEQKVRQVRQFAALFSEFPDAFRSSMIFEYAYHVAVHTLKDSVRNFFPSYLYMEHAAEWVRKALSEPLPEPEIDIDSFDLLTRIVYGDQETTPDAEMAEMYRFYADLQNLNENYRWEMLYSYAKNKYVRSSSLYYASEIHDTAEILHRFYQWITDKNDKRGK